jgi:hypothetical protein
LYSSSTSSFYKFTVDVIYAFIIGESFLRLNNVIIPYQNLSANWLSLLGIGLVYFIVVTGWIYYHKSISALKQRGNWGTVRFIIDLLILFVVYNLLLVANPSSGEKYSSIFIYLIPILYTLYLFWDFAKIKQIESDFKEPADINRFFITFSFAVLSFSIVVFYIYFAITTKLTITEEHINDLDMWFIIIYVIHTISYRLSKPIKKLKISNPT